MCCLTAVCAVCVACASVQPLKSPNMAAPTPTPTPTPTPPPAPVYMYRNGTYAANGSFSTPGGTEQIGVTLSITNDTVTASSITHLAVNGTSMSYENNFIANYKPFVVGKKLKDLSLSKISSASLTPIGFNNATDSIRAQAL